jgi:hypothetical protein
MQPVDRTVFPNLSIDRPDIREILEARIANAQPESTEIHTAKGQMWIKVIDSTMINAAPPGNGI